MWKWVDNVIMTLFHAAILGLFLGALGVHWFWCGVVGGILGYIFTD